MSAVKDLDATYQSKDGWDREQADRASDDVDSKAQTSTQKLKVDPLGRVKGRF